MAAGTEAESVSKDIFAAIVALRAVEKAAGKKAGDEIQESDILPVADQLKVDGPSLVALCDQAVEYFDKLKTTTVYKAV